MTKPASVLTETIDRLTARRAVAAAELAILDEAIRALQRVRVGEMPPPVTLPAQTTRPDPKDVADPEPGPARPTVCALSSCRKRLPAPVRVGGRPRVYCDRRCAQKAYKLETRAAEPAGAHEDPTDRALRLHRELGNTPESGTGYRGRKASR